MLMSLPPSTSAEKSRPKKKHRDKDKSKEKSTVTTVPSNAGRGHVRNEGVDPTWAYQPPDGTVVLDTSQVDEDFDWDSLKDESKELWIVRVPEGFKTKLLDGLEVQQPLNSPGSRLSTLERKHTKYDVWSIEQAGSTEKLAEDDEQSPRGEEAKSLSCLLPRKKKHGKFYLSPKQISQHIIITHSPAVPNVDSQAYPRPSTRDSVPAALLKHRFLPLGALSTSDIVRHSTDSMDVDMANEPIEQEGAVHKAENVPPSITQERSKKAKDGQSPKTASKKRKGAAEGESETPTRKSKKLKV